MTRPKSKSSASTTIVKRKDFNALVERVEELERENADMVERVRRLEAQLYIPQTAPGPSAEAPIDPPSVGWGA